MTDAGRASTAVLLVADQRRGVLPDRCVVTGQRTDTAVRCRALDVRSPGRWDALAGPFAPALCRLVGRATMPVTLPVSEPAWRRFRRRIGAAAVVLGAGAGAVVAGAVDGDPAPAVLGAGLLAGAVALRASALRHHFVELRLRPAQGHILVRRASAPFASAARTRFTAAALDGAPPSRPVRSTRAGERP